MKTNNNLQLPKNYGIHLKHLTATGYVLNSDKTKILLIYHKKFNKWMPPGGHVDKDEMPHDAVLREIQEETGIKATFLLNTTDKKIEKDKEWILPSPYITMLQLVPKNSKEDEHFHYDFSYVLITKLDKLEANLDEVHNVGWFSLDEVLKLETFKIVPQICKSILNNVN